MTLERKVALVTGSGRGIGRGIALAFARAGYDVCVNYNRSAEGAEAVVAEIRAMGLRSEAVQADISTIEGVDRLYAGFRASFDRLDVHVANSGITRMRPFLETTPELFDEVMNTDLRGLYFCSQRAASIMAEQGTKGVLIHISSNHAEGTWSNATVYAAAKAAVNKLTKNMALDLAGYGIRVVGIAPGYTQLGEPKDDRMRAGIAKVSSRIPLGRFATTAEVGEAAVFLSSDHAGYMTGTTMYMDGGSLLPVWADKG
ncbi:SDR family NAD(P)-dependent oxidoreductase [Paenibacillus sacheonensis]|uniref:SDR family oxidoreductase n=1 Tax=Paenibacillus sacheonensis TaxID=742054 RepID=A0A7X5BYC9_9BACL|nr:SDR family oxidoreductase [Paenibacillus sacheonensis]MBM7566826.1 NAD(P)-dependent dehydrogenase (short-subunit alcohol dehydrogenase family) [Paenibacillus sacheonensis]NBC71448.1 SDR family oxidoreductase [Paenibacillus sacheonensis]